MFGQQAGMRLPTEVKRYYESDLFSTFQWADGAALASGTFELFTTAQGAQGQGFGASLTISETNLSESGRIPNGLALTVRGIAAELSYANNWPIVRADIQNIQTYCVLRWSFLNTFIDIAPVSLIGQGGGIFGSTADTGGAVGGVGGSIIALNNGAGQLWQYSELPVLLNAGQSFKMIAAFGSGAAVVDGGTGNSSLRMRIHLLGTFTSAVPQG